MLKIFSLLRFFFKKLPLFIYFDGGEVGYSKYCLYCCRTFCKDMFSFLMACKKILCFMLLLRRCQVGFSFPFNRIWIETMTICISPCSSLLVCYVIIASERNCCTFRYRKVDDVIRRGCFRYRVYDSSSTNFTPVCS
jgi:hypothetical protein